MKDDPLAHIVCHCDDCKKRTGSAFGISAYFSEDQVIKKQGTMHGYEIQNDGYRQNRHFCSNCGTTLYWHITAFSNVIGVSGGCFIEQPLPKPKIVAEKDNNAEWLNLLGEWQESFDIKILTNHTS
jgi:hypothetical protein